VILTVRKDGKILEHSFKKRSHNPLFDDSVLKAIQKSDPLPPFPPGYKKRNEEVEINFSLKDLV
jgi:colicin import membrane protein